MSPELPDPEIIYESSAVIVINKPGGILTQAPPGIDSMELRVRELIKKRNQNANPWVGCLHRLDRPVSGLLAFGLSRRATRKIAEQFESREVRKYYWALVEQAPKVAEGRWVDSMRKVPDEARSELVPKDHPEAREAILNYSAIGQADNMCWLNINLETGRTHQIRLQCAINLAPVLGDELYGSKTAFGPKCTDKRDRCIALHARNIEFFDPGIQKKVQLEAPLPEYWSPLSESFASIPNRSDG